MLTAVQAAVVAAAAAFVAAAGVAVYVMLKGARLMSETSAAVAALRDRGDVLIDRANAAIDQAGEQIARTETVTASMAGVTAAMTELGGHLTALAPAPPAADGAPRGPMTWAAALAYGVRWAVQARWAGATAAQREPGRADGRAGSWRARQVPPPRQATGRQATGAQSPGRAPTGREAGRNAALTVRGNGMPR
jgi:hypothetical protein